MKSYVIPLSRADSSSNEYPHDTSVVIHRDHYLMLIPHLPGRMEPRESITADQLITGLNRHLPFECRLSYQHIRMKLR